LSGGLTIEEVGVEQRYIEGYYYITESYNYVLKLENNCISSSIYCIKPWQMLHLAQYKQFGVVEYMISNTFRNS